MLKNIFRTPSSTFKTRSQDRDRATDEKLVLAVATAIDAALRSAKAEHAGLKQRLDQVISVAAIVGGNEIEEVQPEDDARSDMLRKSDSEIRYGEERLRVLEDNIANFGLLKVDLEKRFANLATGAAPSITTI